jgi:hypothetical protein
MLICVLHDLAYLIGHMVNLFAELKTMQIAPRRKVSLYAMKYATLKNVWILYRHIIYTMYIYTYNLQLQPTILTLFLITYLLTPWYESASELYRPSDRRLSAK